MAERCSAQVWRGKGWSGYACMSVAKRQCENGKWWCGIHHPDAKAARDAKASAKWDLERAAFDAQYDMAQVAANVIANRLGVKVTVLANYSGATRVVVGVQIFLADAVEVQP